MIFSTAHIFQIFYLIKDSCIIIKPIIALVTGHDVTGMKVTIRNSSYHGSDALPGNCYNGLDTLIGRTYMYECQHNLTGRYVVISVDSPNNLYLTEVQVFTGTYEGNKVQKHCIIITLFQPEVRKRALL